MNKIWLSSPHMGGEEFDFVKDAFESNWIAPLGPHVNGFENDLCEYTGAKYAAAVNSGTAAIHLALIMLGVEAGDEVICSTFTFAGSVNPVAYQKAVPVFVDSETLTWNMSPELLEEAIEDRIKKGKKPKAIIFVHLYGMPARTEKILEISRAYNIPTIEDAAEALGSKLNNKFLGTFGEIGILSFNGNKIITTSGGGALLSSKEEYILKAKFLSEQARDPAPHYQHSQIGYNYRLSNICAAIGRGQMKVLDQRVKERRNIFDFYYKNLSPLPGISFLPEPDNYFSNRWLTCIIIDSERSGGITREDVREALVKENIDSRPLWKPLHLQPVFSNYPAYTDGTSEKLFENGLCLPSGTNLSREDLQRIVNVIRNVYSKKIYVG